MKTIKTEFWERREEISFNKSPFSELWQKELEASEKHEILVKICNLIGDSPANFAIAEQIFESLRFDFARYVIHHEYSKEDSVKNRMLVWLDSRVYPDHVKKINEFGELYLK